MLNRFMKKLILLHAIVLILFHGCYPVSHIIIGEKKDPINADQVKVYLDFPDEYEKIAMIEASSDFAFKDMSLEITDQRKTDKALARLKAEAASLGANGIVIQSLSNKNKLHFSLRKDDRGNLNADTRNEKQKELKAIAIFVK
tara:strand:+ start:1402 stop:1830 length:429 start_codon:yes stop_codon:yes gene_type:complete